ncbi:MAG: DUF2157 domain-containing protein [Bradymonadia bacterium]
MKLEKRLNRWVEAGVVDEAAKARILAYERANSKPKLLSAITGLAALAIGLGLISLIAANWDGLSANVKLGIDIILGVTLVFGLYRADRRERLWLRETLIAVITAWTLASIALIGQIYQLGGDTRSALLFWLLLISPLLSQGRSHLVGIVWVGGLILTAGSWFNQLETFYEWVPTLIWGVLWLFYATRIRSFRPEISSVFTLVSLVGIALLSTVGMFVFYDEVEFSMSLASALAPLPFVYLLVRHLDRRTQGDRFWQYVAVASFLLQAPLWALEHIPSVLLGIIVFIGYWGLIARAALSSQMRGLFRFATSMVALRIIVIYFEVFGSLLNTGVLLITGGALSLLIVRVWHKRSKDLLPSDSRGHSE